MIVGDLKFNLDYGNLIITSVPVQPPPLPPKELGPEDFELIEPEVKIPEKKVVRVPGKTINTVPGTEVPKTPAPEYATLIPGSAKGKDLQEILQSFIPANREKAARAASVAQLDPKAYYKSHRYRYVKDRVLDPITAWVLDNKVLTDSNLTIDWLETQNKRAEVEFTPYIHLALKMLIENDPRLLLNAENVWKSNKVGNVAESYLPALWESALKHTPPTKEGRLFVDDDTLKKFQALGREIGRRGHGGFFQDRVFDVLNNMINLRTKSLENDTARNPMEKRTDLITLKQWRHQLDQINRRINMEKKSFINTLAKLVKIATILDVKEQYEFANEIDSILRMAVERPERFVLPEGDLSWADYLKRYEGKRKPGEERILDDPEYGRLEEMKPVEEEWEPKHEKEVRRDIDVENLSEEDLAPEYLENLQGE